MPPFGAGDVAGGPFDRSRAGMVWCPIVKPETRRRASQRRRQTAAGRLLLLLTIAATAGRLPGLDPARSMTQYVLRAWNTQDGLPVDSVQAVLQTRDGYMWIGTQGGLARFNGVSFRVYDGKNTPELRNSSIQCLCEGRDGALWIGTENGLIRFAADRFQVIPYQDGASSRPVFSLLADSRGVVWVGTDQGLDCLSQGRLAPVHRISRHHTGRVCALYEDRTGSLWIGSFESGLIRLREEAVTVWTTAEGLASSKVRALCEDGRGGLWVGSDGGLDLVTGGRVAPRPAARGLPPVMVRSLLRDRDGNTWIGTDGDGVHRLAGGRATALTVASGLTSNSVVALAEDREGSLWMGTGGGGLNQLKNGRFTTYTRREGLCSDHVRTIVQDHRGHIWFATDGGLNQLRGGALSSRPLPPGLGTSFISALFADPRGGLWLGLVGHGMARLDGRRLVDVPLGKGSFVHAITEDHNGDLWVGTENGLRRYHDGRVTVYTRRDGLAGDIVRAVHEDRSCRLWVATLNGLSRMQEGGFTTLGAVDGLESHLVMAIHEDDEGTLWFGTWGGGLARFSEGQFRSFRTHDGLFEDMILSVLEDGQGNLWMGSNKGIGRVRKREFTDIMSGTRQKLHCTVFGIADGMRSPECEGGITPAACRSRDGALWFATVNGAVRIDPGRIEPDRVPPPVRIERIVVDGRPVDGVGRLTLAPGPHRIEFEYVGLSYVQPEKLRFRYRLAGFDSDWVEAGPQRSAAYTNVPPGDYTFRVIAGTSDGFWNRAGASASLALQPHFYQRRLFVAGSVLFLMLGAVALHRLRIRSLKVRQRQLTRLVDQRTHDLQQAMDELERRSLTDPLTQLPNRRHFELLLAQEWRRCLREKQPLSLFMVDVDFFKPYNDTYGHAQGDKCLREVAAAIHRSTSRGGDFVARLGGEEFVVVLPNTPPTGAEKMAERVRGAVQGLGLAHRASASAPCVTISVGVATMVPESGTPDDVLVQRADQALYQAKAGGRNRVCCAGSGGFRSPVAGADAPGSPAAAP